MRIEKIKNAADGRRWVLDQVGHGGIALLCALPWPINAAAVLSAREWEQWRRKSILKREVEASMPFWLRHLDRTVDIVAGVAIGTAVMAVLR